MEVNYGEGEKARGGTYSPTPTWGDHQTIDLKKHNRGRRREAGEFSSSLR